MTNTSTLAKLSTLKAHLEEIVSAYNTAMKAGDLKEMAAQETLLKENEQTYAGLAMNDFFEQVSDKDDYVGTMTRAIKALCYQTIGHTMETVEGVAIGLKLVERSKTVDLQKLCKFNGWKAEWVHPMELFNLLLTLRTATELGLSKDDLKKINDSYYMREKSRELEKGKTPTSNNQVCKNLQEVIDQILFVATEDNEPKNSIRVNSHDVAYLLMCYTRRGRSALKVVCAKHSYLQTLLVEILHRILTGKVYDVDYRMKKN